MDIDSNDKSYYIRCSLIGHSQDVRAVAVSDNGDIVTASRDKTAKLWKELVDAKNVYEEKVEYLGHTGYVSSVCLIPGDENCESGYTATGSKDSAILVYPRMSPNADFQLTGHTDTVSCLIWNDGQLISGSWDHSVRVWMNRECVSVLKGHAGPVWAIAVLNSPDGALILSASADKTIKAWKGNDVVRTYSGHSDCVRGLSVIDESSFASVSNDASVKVWHVDGSCLSTFYGHSNFIYSIYYMSATNSLVTGGEDRSVRVWDMSGINCATVHVPAQSVWAVAALPNADLVVGSSDGVCRVFTSSQERKASPEDVEIYEKSVGNFKVAVEDIGGIKKSNVPDKSVLLMPGKRDGQTIMVRDGDKILCYNWSQAKNEWEAVGEVVGGTGGTASSSGKILFEGREYDYVFDVDLDDGRPLKLPYNRGEDPWTVAQSFIYRHELPQDHLDQIAKFITTNANVDASYTNGSGYYDPFTGGNRYVPSGNNMSNQSTISNGSSAINANSPYFPQKTPLKFENINKEGMLIKLKECNALVSKPLPEDVLSRMVDAVSSEKPVINDLELLEEALTWPYERVWPALDVLRLGLRFEAVQAKLLADEKGAVLLGLLNELINPPSPLPTQLLSLRCIANLASFSQGRKILYDSFTVIIISLTSLCPYPNKNTEIAAATVILNYSVVFNEMKNAEDQCQLLSAASTIALTAKDPEAQFRVLVALGTILTDSGKSIGSLAKSLDIKTVVEKFAYLREPHKLVECAKHVLKLL